MRRTITICIVAVVLAVGTPVVATVIDSRLECERIAEWAENNAKSYPPSAEALAQLPIEYRRAAFAVQPSQRRAELWREHVGQFLKDPSITTRQREWLIGLQAFIRADLFENRAKYESQIRALVVESKDLFGTGRAKLILATLGPLTHTFPTNRVAVLAAASAWLRASTSPAAEGEFANCSCSQSSDWCSPYPTSPTARCAEYTPCVIVPDSCGTFWVYDCDGNCGPE